MNAAPLCKEGDECIVGNRNSLLHALDAGNNSAIACIVRGGRVNGGARRLVRPNHRNNGCLLVRC